MRDCGECQSSIKNGGGDPWVVEPVPTDAIPVSPPASQARDASGRFGSHTGSPSASTRSNLQTVLQLTDRNRISFSGSGISGLMT